MKSAPGRLVVSWMTAAETRPMMSACTRLGRTTRMVMQKAEMMNSGLIMPADMAPMALPSVMLRMKPAASRTASNTRALMSSLPRSTVETVRAWGVRVFWDMVIILFCEMVEVGCGGA